MNKEFEAYKTALRYAENAHRGQVRKYSDSPYILHPIRVERLVCHYAPELYDDRINLSIAALVHDTVEDCAISLSDIRSEFGEHVARMVRDLTHESCFDANLSKQNRATRWAADIEKLSKANLDSRLIKMCDRLDNLNDMPLSDPWTKKYLVESDTLMNAISHGLYKVFADYEQIKDRILNANVR